MPDDDLAARYETLRAAAAEVLHSALKNRRPAPYTAELQELHRVLLESPASAPARHSLAFTDYREDGSAGPYELTKLAAEIRAELAADRTTREHIPGQPVRNVVLTQLRAMVVGGLLTELAARLAPGPAMGLDEAGRDLAEIAAKLGENLVNQTSAGS